MAPAAENFLIIVGVGRSGTTWLQRLLVSHPGICGGPESHFFSTFGSVLPQFERQGHDPRPHGMACFIRREELVAELRKVWDRTIQSCTEAHPQATWYSEQTPANWRFTETIREVLPEARFVHMARDSRAVIASLLAASRSQWGKQWATGSLRQATNNWNRGIGASESLGKSIGPERFLRLHYEDLAANTGEVLTRLFEFLGLETPKELIGQIVESQSFDRQQAAGGSSFWFGGEYAGKSFREPAGFIRSGPNSHWKSQLNLFQRTYIWHRTKENLTRLGYRKDGGFRPHSENS